MYIGTKARGIRTRVRKINTALLTRKRIVYKMRKKRVWKINFMKKTRYLIRNTKFNSLKICASFSILQIEMSAVLPSGKVATFDKSREIFKF
jgi:hypothetical protein